MPDITNIASPATVSGSDIGAKRDINGAKAAESDDAEHKSQNDDVSFLSSFQQSLATINEQSDKADACSDGNNLPACDAAAASFLSLSDQAAIADNEMPATAAGASSLQQLRRPTAGTTAMQLTGSAQIGDTDSPPVLGELSGVAQTGSAGGETASLLTSHMLQHDASQSGEMATDRRALEMLMSADRSVVAGSAHAVHTPAPMHTASVETATAITAQTTLSETFGRPEWAQGLGRQMLMMVNQNMHSAEMRLNPAHLGPIEVRIKMDDDQVSVAFNSQHAVVREALETAIPRLREMFESSGMNLSNTDISHQSFAEQQNNAYNDSEQRGFASHLPMIDDSQSAQLQSSRHQVNIGMVDCYI